MVVSFSLFYFYIFFLPISFPISMRSIRVSHAYRYLLMWDIYFSGQFYGRSANSRSSYLSFQLFIGKAMLKHRKITGQSTANEVAPL